MDYVLALIPLPEIWKVIKAKQTVSKCDTNNVEWAVLRFKISPFNSFFFYYGTANFKSNKGYNSITIKTRIIPIAIHVHIASGNIWHQVFFESLGFLSLRSKVKIVHDADDDDDDDNDAKGIKIARLFMNNI